MSPEPGFARLSSFTSLRQSPDALGSHGALPSVEELCRCQIGAVGRSAQRGKGGDDSRRLAAGDTSGAECPGVPIPLRARTHGESLMNMLILKLTLQRVALALLSLLVVSAMVFAITAVLPGDAAQAQLGQEATPETLAALRHQMGLDVPAPVRYGRWLAGLLSGQPGDSIVTHTPVADMLASRLPNSLLLAAITIVVAVPLALVLGIVAAMYRGSVFDRVVSGGAIAVVSVPEFLVATLAVLVFAVELHWLPALSYSVSLDSPMKMLRSFAMPVMTLCCVMVANMMRMTRAAVIDQLKAPYIEMVLLKGASPMRVVLAHALPNAVGPIANAVAMTLSYLLGGVIIVETIFNYPGVASLMVDGVTQRDMPLVQTCAMLFCAAYLALVTLADIVSIVANPRLRYR